MTIAVIEADVKAFFEKLIAEIKAAIPGEHHAAVDKAAASIPKPEAVSVAVAPVGSNVPPVIPKAQQKAEAANRELQEEVQKQSKPPVAAGVVIPPEPPASQTTNSGSDVANPNPTDSATK